MAAPAPAARGRPARPASWPATSWRWPLVWAALVAPDSWPGTGPAALLRIPLEGVLLVALVLVLPARPARLLAGVAGLALALLTLLRLLDVGFGASLGRPFDPLYDWGYAGSAVGLLRDSVGGPAADAVLVGVVLLTAAVLVGVPAAVLRVTALARRHRGGSARAVSAVGVAWVLSAVLGLQALPGAPVASTSTAALAYDRVGLVRTSYRGQREFTAALTADPLADVPAGDLLTGLRGRDVLVVFVESYGRVALEDPDAARHVLPALARDTATLRAAGFHARSGFLDSPTFGGLSWLAHSTLQSGLRVDHQRRYDALLASPRRTLASAFHTAGWRTVDVVPSNRRPVARGCPLLRLGPDLRRPGPRVRRAGVRLRDDAGPVRPRRVPAPRARRRGPRAGDGRDRPGVEPHPVGAAARDGPRRRTWATARCSTACRRAATASRTSGGTRPGCATPTDARWPTRWTRSPRSSPGPTPTRWCVVLGDHQPATVVSGYGASHDVPVSVLARDPAVLRRIADWGWAPGLRPDEDGPVRPMESFRDSFLAAYGPTPQEHTERGALNQGAARR